MSRWHPGVQLPVQDGASLPAAVSRWSCRASQLLHTGASLLRGHLQGLILGVLEVVPRTEERSPPWRPLSQTEGDRLSSMSWGVRPCSGCKAGDAPRWAAGTATPPRLIPPHPLPPPLAPFFSTPASSWSRSSAFEELVNNDSKSGAWHLYQNDTVCTPVTPPSGG